MSLPSRIAQSFRYASACLTTSKVEETKDEKVLSTDKEKPTTTFIAKEKTEESKFFHKISSEVEHKEESKSPVEKKLSLWNVNSEIFKKFGFDYPSEEEFKEYTDVVKENRKMARECSEKLAALKKEDSKTDKA